MARKLIKWIGKSGQILAGSVMSDFNIDHSIDPFNLNHKCFPVTVEILFLINYEKSNFKKKLKTI